MVVRARDEARAHLVAQDPADARHAGHVELVADALVHQSVFDFPGEDARISGFEFADEVDNLRMLNQVNWALDWQDLRLVCPLTLTLGVVTRGLLPPIAPGRKEPVSLNLARILETQPCETFRRRLMSHGLTPTLAMSMIRRRMWFGNGRPLTKYPPS